MPKQNKPEKRFLKINNAEIRSVESGEGEDTTEQRFVRGTGVVYGEETEIWEGYMETIRAGAFADSLSDGSEIKSYFNHNPNFVLATTESEPKLELKSDDNGLLFDAPIPPTTYGNDLTVNLERGNVRGASFTFVVQEDVVTIDENDVYHREITKATLYEVGPVTNPAYPQTEIGLRDRESSFEEMRKRVEAQELLHRDSESSSLELLKMKQSILEIS